MHIRIALDLLTSFNKCNSSSTTSYIIIMVGLDWTLGWAGYSYLILKNGRISRHLLRQHTYPNYISRLGGILYSKWA